MNIPILLVFFNREDTIVQLISKLAEIKPSVLYLACDGGRTPNEHLLVESIRETVISSINWECEVYKNYSDTNLGCKYAVHRAIQWFFSCVPEGIVLEDDCIPSSAFFCHAEQMLNLYRDDHSIATIAARNELIQFNPGQPVYCSKFFCWGWASWADRILGIDVETGYTKDLAPTFYDEYGLFESFHIRGIQQLMIKNIVSSWAYSYDLHFRSSNQLNVLPPYNYIKNIGLSQGAHSNGSIDYDKHAVSSEELSIECFDINPTKTKGYIEAYLIKKYGYIKLFLFPFIGLIKKLKQFRI